MCKVTLQYMSYQEKRRVRENRIKQPFCTMQRINPLGSTMSITSMLFSAYTD
ncbi:unnamed protein product [Staurois parvus]|uniref:Uncharacterized protein n=1 Tax=Staurois parvus TaxID=386267 RepID=A0ABN9EQR0_9NEOB|nr:unnamed protein product [Staurois parvus]